MSLFAELRRRNVFRVGVAYAAIAWLLVQVADVVFPLLGAPDWVLNILVVVLLLGLPVAVVFAWVFELTPEGVKREKDIDRSASITRSTGRKLDRVIIVVLVIALGYFIWERPGTHRAGGARRTVWDREQHRCRGACPRQTLHRGAALRQHERGP
jgi:hypothetical protein